MMKHGTKLVEVAPLPGHRLKLAYNDGARFTLDITDLIESGGVYAALRDEHVFTKVSLAADGSYIEFPGEIDFCADSLRQSAEVQQLQPAS